MLIFQTNFPNISLRVLELRSGHDFILKFTKENNSVRKGGVTTLVFCFSSESIFNLYQVK